MAVYPCIVVSRARLQYLGRLMAAHRNLLRSRGKSGLEEVLHGQRSPRVYIASALTNAELNARVAHALTVHSWTCFLPQRDAPMSDDGAVIAAANLGGLLGADLIVALAYQMGRDTAWEVGFAAAREIPIVLVSPTDAEPQHDMMVFSAASCVLQLDAADVPARLPSLLDQFLAEIRAQDPTR